jgi:DNA-binding SARP family transcriptional activator/tetratricopeptide (TPR) repeat protein
VLRGKLGGDAIEADRDHVRFAYPYLDLDIDRLLTGDILGDEFQPPLEVCSFLEGFDLPDAGEFMLWRDRQQARLLPAIRDGLVKLMDRCRRTGDFRRIETLAERMLAIDELSEDAIRAKMEARAFAGDRLDALKIFETWKTHLAEELEAQPSPLLEGIALRLRRRGWERANTNHVPAVQTDQWRGHHFVGRSTEYRKLYEAWEGTRDGAGSHLLILGDSGVGKSTLVERLVTAAGLEGAASARVQCYEVEREIPYAAVSGLVRSMIDRPGATATPPEWLAELARTVPEVRQRYSTIPTAPDSQGETARVRLAEGVHQLLTAIAEETPVILVVDDVHLSDDASVAVLHLVMRRIQAQRIMILLTARPAELHRSPNARRLRENRKHLGLELLDLPPLTDEESQQLLSALVSDDQPQPPSLVRRAIVRAASGFPMVLELLVRDWRVNQDHCLALTLGGMSAELTGSPAPEDIYRQLVDRTIGELDATTRNVLNLASILGSRLNDLTMYNLVDLSLAQTMTGMARLTEFRLLRDGGEELEFRNELIRGHAYLSVPSPLRKVLHSQIANRLLVAEREGQEASGLEIAWHCMRSGRVEEGTPYLFKGAREAMLRGAVHEAELGLTTAARNLVEPPRSEAYLLLAEVLQEQERWAESQEALRNCIDNGNTDRQDLVQVLTYSATVIKPTLVSERRDQAEALLELITRSKVARTRVRAAVTAARVAAALRSKELASKLLDTLDSLDEPIEPEELAPILLARAMALYLNRDTRLSIECISRAASRLVAVGAGNSDVASLECGLGANLCALGEYDDAIPHFITAHDLASRLGNFHLACQSAANAALCFGRIGDYLKQVSWSSRACTHAEYSTEHSRILAPLTGAFGYAMQGLEQEAIAALQLGRPGQANLSARFLDQTYHLMVADIYQLLRKEREALREGEEATTGEGLVLHTDAVAGQFARWLAIVGANHPEQGKFEKRLQELLVGIDALDAIDQVEVLAAAVYLKKHAGQNWKHYYDEMSARLSALPAPITIQLERLGIIQPTQGQTVPGLNEIAPARATRSSPLPRNPRSPRPTPAPTHAT